MQKILSPFFIIGCTIAEAAKRCLFASKTQVQCRVTSRKIGGVRWTMYGLKQVTLKVILFSHANHHPTTVPHSSVTALRGV
jgi:hypothetical protein